MSIKLCVYILFDNNRDPLVAGILDTKTNAKKIYDLYTKGSGATLYDVVSNVAEIADIINNAIANNVLVITSNFKSILSAFPIQLVQNIDYNIYDLCFGSSKSISNQVNNGRVIVDKALDLLAVADYLPWQKIFANAAVVYQSIENRGVDFNAMRFKPIWEQTTYSGRSKNRGCNIQGVDGAPGLMNPAGNCDDLHVYFDWVAADLRVASLISGDVLLQNTFVDSDPYSVLHEMLTTDTGTISRDDCKQQLLQAINSFNFSHPVLEEIFVDLGKWLLRSKRQLDDTGVLSSMLDRKFLLANARNNNQLAVLNGVLQGSVAHSMQLSIKRIWNIYGDQLLTEIHDSIAMTVKPEYVNSLIKGVVAIMCRPFVGVLDSNPFFPVKVSIGRRFREWQPIRIYRERGMEKLNDEIVKRSTEKAESIC